VIEAAINQIGKGSGVHPLGESSPPPPIQQLNVKVSGEMAHAVITDNNPITRNVHYFLEYANEPSFLQPHVEHLGTSRTRILSLPSNMDGTPDPTTGITSPGAPQQWYFRAFSQYPGSKPSPHQYFGGTTPTPVTMQGATNLTLLPSTGSGTAGANGQQGGYGFGRFLRRPAVLPKRSVRT